MRVTEEGINFDCNEKGELVIHENDLEHIAPVQKLYIILQSLLPSKPSYSPRIGVEDGKVWGRMFFEIHHALDAHHMLSTADFRDLASYNEESGLSLKNLLAQYKAAVQKKETRSFAEIATNSATKHHSIAVQDNSTVRRAVSDFIKAKISGAWVKDFQTVRSYVLISECCLSTIGLKLFGQDQEMMKLVDEWQRTCKK